jgi:DNA-binding GntR family transcriptional regulator
MPGLALNLDRSSPIPLYFQVAQQLEEAIRSGQLAPGARLENEVDLADRFGLSRPTVRQAIQELVRKGMLVRKRGVGTQVVQGQLHSEFTRPVALSSLYDDLSRTGRLPRTEVLSHALEPANAQIAAALGVREGSDVVRVERLRWAGDEPLALMCNWLPIGLASYTTEELATHGLYELLRRSGVHMRIATQRIGARAATTGEAKLLHERKGAPLLTMERTAYDDSGRAVEFGSHAYRAQTYSFEVTLVER